TIARNWDSRSGANPSRVTVSVRSLSAVTATAGVRDGAAPPSTGPYSICTRPGALRRCQTRAERPATSNVAGPYSTCERAVARCSSLAQPGSATSGASPRARRNARRSSALTVSGPLPQPVDRHATGGQHQPDVVERLDALSRVACNSQQVGGQPRRDASGLALEPEHARRGGRRGLDGGQRRQAALDHALELGDERAVGIERRAGIRAGGDRHAQAERHLEALAVTLAHRERLA